MLSFRVRAKCVGQGVVAVRRSITKCFVALVGLLVLVGCSVSDQDCIKRSVEYNNVKAVLFHSPFHYSIMYQALGETRLEVVEFRASTEDGNTENKFALYTDVPADQPLHAKLTTRYERHMCRGTYEIHVHSVADIAGAESDHGKGGSSPTIVIDRAIPSKVE
jgi:hypothetical protein